MALNPATLTRYTGYFENDISAERFAITLDGAIIKLACFDTVTGAITTSSILSIDASTMRMGGGTKDQVLKNADLRAIWRLHPKYTMVMFAMQGDEVGSFTMNKVKYSRYQTGESALLQLPPEIRQDIWRYVLDDPGTIAISVPKDGKSFLQDPARDNAPYNRISEICKEFSREARYLEMSINHLRVEEDRGLHLVRVLNLSDAFLDRTMRTVTYMSSWGPERTPRLPVLHGLLKYAKKNEHVRIDIKLDRWSLVNAKPISIREGFVRFGMGLSKAFRGAKEGSNDDTIFVEKFWRSNAKLEEVDAHNVRFWPKDGELSEKDWGKVKSACAVKPFKKVISGYGVSDKEALDNLMLVLRSYYAKGA
ncbi:hypothetical protein J4E90_009635 [Alternaria incomplexa]|uniref:uncharacterized protein n=1 Tax=Alternaria incomplexa TaxID=1187928 RepID=UPI00222014C9|nr:uncharacterized protein J4E90_009635 [Alternaria incomplexa]KAI4907606.1 hypothetical protein J4E90_009635 [Alternaria incomplexa]